MANPNNPSGVAEKISDILQKKRKRNMRRRLLGNGLRISMLLCLAVLLAVTVYRYKDELSLEKLRAGLLVTEEYGGLNRLASMADSTARYAVLGTGLAVATTEGVQYAPYSGDGFRIDTPLSKPGITGNDQGVLAFDRGGTALILATVKGLTAQAEAEGTILTANQNNAGYSAVIWEEQGYKSSVAAYDRQLRRQYLWQTPHYYCLSAAVSEDGRFMAAAAVTDDGQGHIAGSVLFFALEQEGISASKSLGDALPLAVLAGEKGFSVVTDQGVFAFANDGKAEDGYFLVAGESLRGFVFGEDLLYLWLETESVTHKFAVVCLKEGALPAGRIDTGRDIRGMTASGDALALLIGDDLQLYREMQMQKIISGRTGAKEIFLLPDMRVVFMTGQEIYIAAGQ